jgi:phage-related protein
MSFNVNILKAAKKFLESLPVEAREKVLYNIDKAKLSNDPELFKKLRNNIWEFRTTYKGTRYRLLAFWDKRDKKNTLVVCTCGLVKDTSKVPDKEIERAEYIMNLYFTHK